MKCRIVAKVEELMALCDEIKARLTATIHRQLILSDPK